MTNQMKIVKVSCKWDTQHQSLLARFLIGKWKVTIMRILIK